MNGITDDLMGATNLKIPKRSQEITERYFQFLDKHIADVVSGQVNEFMKIKQIAGRLFVSHQHLTDTIQKQTGHHPCYFYDLKIIDLAKQMLTRSDRSVSEVAGILTYDPANFSKFFKKFTGQTPGQFKKDQQINPKNSP